MFITLSTFSLFLVNLEYLAIVSDSTSLKNDWIVFIYHQTASNMLGSSSEVGDNFASRIVITAAFGPAINQPKNSPFINLILHRFVHWASHLNFICINESVSFSNRRMSWFHPNFYKFWLHICILYIWINIWNHWLRNFVFCHPHWTEIIGWVKRIDWTHLFLHLLKIFFTKLINFTINLEAFISAWEIANNRFTGIMHHNLFICSIFI